MYDAVRRARGSGGVADLADVVRRSRRAHGERQVRAALRVLEAAGALRLRRASGGAPWLRLIASPARIERELRGEERAAAGRLLDALRASFDAAALHAGVELTPAVLRGIGTTVDDARTILDALQAECFLEWNPWSAAERVEVAVDARADRPPVDWAAMRADRRRELEKLRRMTRYAAHVGCRRGYVLRYFGDPAAMDRCDGCDNCGHGLAPILPGLPRAGRRRRGRLFRRLIRSPKL